MPFYAAVHGLWDSHLDRITGFPLQTTTDSSPSMRGDLHRYVSPRKTSSSPDPIVETLSVRSSHNESQASERRTNGVTPDTNALEDLWRFCGVGYREIWDSLPLRSVCGVRFAAEPLCQAFHPCSESAKLKLTEKSWWCYRLSSHRLHHDGPFLQLNHTDKPGKNPPGLFRPALPPR